MHGFSRFACTLCILPALCQGCATNLQLAKRECEHRGISANGPEEQSHCVRREKARIDALERQNETELDERLRKEGWTPENSLVPYR